MPESAQVPSPHTLAQDQWFLRNSRLMLRLFKLSPSNHLLFLLPSWPPLSPPPAIHTSQMPTYKEGPGLPELLWWGGSICSSLPEAWRRLLILGRSPASIHSTLESRGGLPCSIKAQCLSANLSPSRFNCLDAFIAGMEGTVSPLVCSVATLASSSQRAGVHHHTPVKKLHLFLLKSHRQDNTHSIRKHRRGSGVAQCEKALAPKPHDLSSIPRLHTVDRENQLLEVTL